jgi:hypothetical protein
MVSTRTSRKRFQSLLALLVFLTGLVEPVVGESRDGAVHHESSAEAWAHSTMAPGGEHGHEDGGASSANQAHTQGHQHGTGQDHCTHAHGPFVGETTGFAWPVLVRTVNDPLILYELAGPRSQAPPPPKI